MRRTSAGVITPPHFGHTALSDARTFSRLIFRALGIGLGLFYSCPSRVHQTLRLTPAMVAGLSDYVWTLQELVYLLNSKELAEPLAA
jgi:hypothetical protein